MKILHLTLKGQWFDMIASEGKPEEYREIKDYWIKRLRKPYQGTPGEYREYDAVSFRHGYSKESRVMLLEFKGTRNGIGNKAWGAPDEPVFIISLGKILNKNF